MRCGWVLDSARGGVDGVSVRRDAHLRCVPGKSRRIAASRTAGSVSGNCSRTWAASPSAVGMSRPARLSSYSRPPRALNLGQTRATERPDMAPSVGFATGREERRATDRGRAPGGSSRASGHSQRRSVGHWEGADGCGRVRSVKAGVSRSGPGSRRRTGRGRGPRRRTKTRGCTGAPLREVGTVGRPVGDSMRAAA